MQAYRFETKVSKDGTIRVPKNSKFIDKEVEVIILPKKKDSSKKITASEFVDKWAGFLQQSDPDASKLDYLTNKYK